MEGNEATEICQTCRYFLEEKENLLGHDELLGNR